jgi:glycosyltransferase involved in cell wall biosynthesis
LKDSESGDAVVILIPVYNDWGPVETLLYELDRALSVCGICPDVLLVDDGSSLPIPSLFLEKGLHVIGHVDVLTLKRNLGHQRAIATGLVFVYGSMPGRPVLIMDGDGEDAPGDVPLLIETFRREGGTHIIFAERTKRAESVTFKLFYRLYKIVHFGLTGVKVRVGNFSIVPSTVVSRLVIICEIWNHYAAAVFNARLPYSTVPTARGKRIAGQSKMSFVSLVIHGLSAISVYGQIVGVRLLIAASVFIAVVIGLITSTLLVRLLTNMAIPGWATFTTGLLFIMVLQTVAIGFLLVFVILYSRSSSTVIPLRECPLFIERVKRVFSNDAV